MVQVKYDITFSFFVDLKSSVEEMFSWVWWPMPVIPALWEDCLSPGVGDEPGQLSEISSLQKKKKKLKIWPGMVAHAYSPSYLGS